MCSLERHGQIQPVLVRTTAGGLELVAGYARVAALGRLGRPVLARLVETENPAEPGLLYLADNAQRPLDDAMRLAAWHHFRPLLDDARLAEEVLPCLGITPGSRDAKLLADWLSLPKQWQGNLAAGRVPLAAGTVLSRMTDADRQAVAPLFAELSWSRSNAVNLLTWLFEAARMTGRPVARIMTEQGMEQTTQRGLSPKDAMSRLAALAREARHPTLSAMQARFTAAASDLTTGTRWRITQPDHFETDGVELSARIASPDQLERAVRDLQIMAERPSWHQLWKATTDHD
nr:ParB/RepB/Spo0J family partition protein [Pseudodesulfovibrio alkaliphilus]